MIRGPKWIQSANRCVGPRNPATTERNARSTIGASITVGDSCGCPVPRYSPKNVSNTARIM